MGENMKVITIKQPFASLIAEGYKEYEFRTWKTKYRGEVLIHAGKGVDRKAMKKYEYLGLEYPSGAIIAKAEITDCITIDDKAREILKSKNSPCYDTVCNDTSFKGFGFKLDNIKKIKPIEINGKLSLWNYEYNG